MANLYEITLSKADYSNYYNSEKDEDCTVDFKKYDYDNEWDTGDIIGIKNSSDYGYRNTGKVTWTGTKLISLDYSVDDYGSAPKELALGSSGITDTYYWKDLINHNQFVYAKFDTNIHRIVNNVWKYRKASTEKSMIELYEEYEVKIAYFNNTITHDYKIIDFSYTQNISYTSISFEFDFTTWGIILPSINFDYKPWNVRPFPNVLEQGLFSYIDYTDNFQKYYKIKDVHNQNILYFGQLE